MVVGLPFLEFQCNRVDAVSLAGWLRTVLEDVSLVAATTGAVVLGARQEELEVALGVDVILDDVGI